jgi:hypothetical protein
MEYTDRGFGTTSGFKSTYYGDITVRESSNAMGPFLWIFAEKNPISDEPAPHLQFSLEEAKMLRYDLDKMIAHLKTTWENES